VTGWWLTHWTEVLGFVTGGLCVLLAARRVIWNYPLGIANNVVFIGLFVSHALYADAGLQVVYLVLGVTGWVGWARRPALDERVAVAALPRRAVPVLVAAGLVGSAVLVLVLRQTDSTTVVADATTTAVSLVAQVMLNRRWISSWFVWIAVDVAYVGLYLSKGLMITAALYVLFIAICALGYRTWRHAPADADDTRDAPPVPALATDG
jgi:nicotinamide mononucleotide transporter